MYFDALTPEEKSEVVKARKVSEKKRYNCFNPKCINLTEGIRNHLLQKNGILSNIQNDKGEVWFFNTDTFSENFQFTKKHINQAYRFNGLCNKCDDSIFLEIEKKEPDFSSAYTHYLFSLRAFLCEKRKQDIHLDHINRLKNLSFWDKIADDRLATEQNVLYKKYLFEMYENCYFKTSDTQENKIVSKHRYLPKLGVACSVSIGLYAHTKLGEPRAHQYFHIYYL